MNKKTVLAELRWLQDHKRMHDRRKLPGKITRAPIIAAIGDLIENDEYPADRVERLERLAAQLGKDASAVPALGHALFRLKWAIEIVYKKEGIRPRLSIAMNGSIDYLSD